MIEEKEAEEVKDEVDELMGNYPHLKRELPEVKPGEIGLMYEGYRG